MSNDVMREHKLREIIAALILEAEETGITQVTRKVAIDAISTPYRIPSSAPAQSEAKVLCETCGGSKVDPGGEGYCRSCKQQRVEPAVVKASGGNAHAKMLMDLQVLEDGTPLYTAPPSEAKPVAWTSQIQLDQMRRDDGQETSEMHPAPGEINCTDCDGLPYHEKIDIPLYTAPSAAPAQNDTPSQMNFGADATLTPGPQDTFADGIREAARLIQMWQSFEPAHSTLHDFSMRDASRIISSWPARLRGMASDYKDAAPAQPVTSRDDIERAIAFHHLEMLANGPVVAMQKTLSEFSAARAQPVAWTARWHGSNLERGWSIYAGRDCIAYIGGDEGMSEAISEIVAAHNKCFDCDGGPCVMNCSGRARQRTKNDRPRNA